MMQNTFQKRLDKGKELSNEFISFLDSNNIKYMLSGYEYLTASEGSRDIIIKNKDRTSLFIRHYPDLAILYNGKSCLIEIKNSSGIEKDCYFNYLYLSKDLNINVFLFLKNKKICDVKDLIFSNSNGFDSIAEMNIPITEKVWREPRLMNEDNYKEYLRAYREKKKYTSGCSFAFIDFENTTFYEKEILIKK